MNGIVRGARRAIAGHSIAPERAPLPRLATVAIATYAVRDSLSGAIRWALHVGHGDSLWLLGDLPAMLLLPLFMVERCMRQRAAAAWFLMLVMAGAMAIAAAYVAADPAYLASAFKMILPLVVGAALGRADVHRMPGVVRLFEALILIGALGVFLAMRIRFPWVGLSVDTLGVPHEAGRLWWIGPDQRYGGFAAQSTMAGVCLVVLWLFIHRALPWWRNLGLGALVVAATLVTTSRTSAIAAALTLTYVVVNLFDVAAIRALRTHRVVAAGAVMLGMLPVGAVLLLSHAHLEQVTPALASLQARIDAGWQQPFAFLAHDFPLGLVTGCGAGCFNYPMALTRLAPVLVPVDNFDLASYLQFGLPFAGFVAATLWTVARSHNRAKLVIVTVTSVMGLTIQGYAPTLMTAAMVIGVSDMFAGGVAATRPVTRRRRASRRWSRAGRHVPEPG